VTHLLLLRHATRPFEALAEFRGPHAEATGRAWLDAEGRCEADAARLEVELHAAAGPRAAIPGETASRARLAILALRRAVHNRRAWTRDELEAASPGLPAALHEALIGHARSLEASRAAERAWVAAFNDDLDTGRRALLRATADPLVATAMTLLGRSMSGKVRALRSIDIAAWGHGERHVAAKALAYLGRFSTKTSPHSVFCATALAKAGGEAALTEGRPVIVRWDLILNVAEARKVACVLAADPAVECAVVPRPNPTLRAEDDALTFWRFASLRNAGDDESYSRVREHPVLRAALDEASAGVPLPVLRRRIAARCDLDEAQLAPFLRQAIGSGVLIGEIEIPYNERRPLRFVATRAREAGGDAAWIAPALDVERDVDLLVGRAPSELASELSKVEAALSALPHARPIASEALFRLDAASALQVSLPASVLEDLKRGLRPYTRLFAALYPARRYLQGWIDRYLARFPPDRDVELIDVYRAVTEQADSYRPAAFPEPSGQEAGGTPGAAAAMAAVKDYLAAAALTVDGDRPIVLDETVLERLIPDAPDPRWACGVLFQVAAPDVAAIARGEHLLVLNGLFHGAGLSLSRFSHLLGGEDRDPGNPVVRELRRAWSVLDRPGAIVAELTYNHLARTANAGLRPAIFTHEIELPGDCASPGARALGLRDLVVRFDTRADRFVLRMAGGGAEVIPVINSGVNPVGFVSFLVAIGEQTLQPIGYFPGFDVPEVTHWPRVAAGRVVLFRERWVFRKGEWPKPPGRGDDLLPFGRAVLRWRERFRLPRHVFVHSSKEPKPRYVDCGSPVFLDLLRRDLAALADETDATLHVTEMFPGPGDLFVTDGAGAYAAEFLVQLDGGPVGSLR